MLYSSNKPTVIPLLVEHWQWTLGLIVGLLCLLAYRHLLRKAQAYTLRVKEELEGYVKQSSHAVTPLPIPPRNLSDSLTLADEKKAIWERIHKHPLPHYQQIDLLVCQLAESNIAVRFQDNYFVIFGSQHAFLRWLNSQTNGTGSMSRVAAQEYLQQLAKTNASVANAHYDFNHWLAPLVSCGYVNVGVDSVKITAGGQDFLVWIMRRQLPERTYERS